MAQTPSSSSAPFADWEDLIERYDVRSVLQLASDSDTPLPFSELASNTRVAAALSDASGDVEAACTLGERYRPEDLEALTGNSLSLLKRLVCDLAMGYLFGARPDRRGVPPESFKAAKDTLKQIKLGELVFGLLQSQQAAALDSATETPAIVRSRQDTTVIAERYFGRRGNLIRGGLQ